MMSHLDHLLRAIPDLASRSILDVGAGRGGFLIEVAKRGLHGEGVEYSTRYITYAQERARQEGVSIRIQHGVGEALPYPNDSFSFINLAEVLEHVREPQKVLSEVQRVLSDDGLAYISIPNRFGFIDPHYHTPFVNWLPRRTADYFLRWFGKQKEQSSGETGHQRLKDMHYMTLHEFENVCEALGLGFSESREERLRRMFPMVRGMLVPLYRAFAFFFIPTFHGLASKKV